MVGISDGVNGHGLNLANLDETTQAEIDAYLTTRWKGRGPLYDQYAMIRQHMLTNNREALREAVLLGRAWGITREWMALAFATTAYYTGFEALYAAYDAVHDILQSMS